MAADRKNRKEARVEDPPGDFRRRTSRGSRASSRETEILRHIHAAGAISRVDLAGLSGLSSASITAVVKRLVAKGLVVESGQVTGELGRRPILLALRGDVGYVIGVDLGSFYLRVVITDINGRAVVRRQTTTELYEGRQRVLQKTFALIEEAIAQSGLPRRALRGIGIGHSGVIDVSRGVVLSLPRAGQMLQWKNVPLRSIFEQQFQLPTLLEDSVRTRATAEKHYGLGKNLRDFIYIDVGMGIGAAIFINGAIYRGAGGNAGEFGHITVEEKGPLCPCGNRGCVEALASCAAIIQAVRSAIDKGVDSRVRDMVNGDLKQIGIETIVQAAMDNDALAFRVLQEALTHIGVALADVVNLLNPKIVIFGGGLFHAAPPFLLDTLMRPVRQRALEKSANEVNFAVSTLPSEAGALGAARLIAIDLLEAVCGQFAKRQAEEHQTVN